jgi:hypothetical protein
MRQVIAYELRAENCYIGMRVGLNNGTSAGEHWNSTGSPGHKRLRLRGREG